MKPEDTTWAETQRAIHKPQNRTAMNSETPQVDELVHRITNNPGVTWSHSEICEMIELAMRLELRCKRLEEALTRIRDGALVSSAQSNPHFNPKWIAYEALADQQEEKP